MDGEEDAALHLELRGAGLLHAEEFGGGCPLRLAGPLQPGPVRIAARQRAGVHRLGARHEYDVVLTPADGAARVVHERLRVVAPDGGDHELGRLVALGEAEPLGDQTGRIGGVPAQGRHHSDAVGAPDDGAPRRCAPAGRGVVAVLGRRQQGGRHELQRFRPVSGVEPRIRGRGNLADTDHDRGARVERHGPSSVAVDATGAPWRTGRLGGHACRRRPGSRRARPRGRREGRVRPPHPSRRDSMSSYETALAADAEVASLVGQELDRQQTTLQLIASENFTSPAVLAATGSVLTNKYSEGYPGRRYYGGNQIIDEVEELARAARHCPLRRRPRQRAAARRGQRQPGGVPGAARAGGDDPRHAARPRWPPHPRVARIDRLEVLALRLLRRDAGSRRTRRTPARSSTSTRWPTWPRRRSRP